VSERYLVSKTNYNSSYTSSGLEKVTPAPIHSTVSVAALLPLG
jgi:hypothetical protein